MVKWEPIVDSSIWQWLDVTLSPNSPHVLFSSTLEKLWPGHLLAISGPLETSSKFDKKNSIVILFMICISRQLCRFWMNFSMCLPGKSYLFSLQTFKEIEWKINPFTFADLSLSFCPWPRCSQTSWSVFRGSGTAQSTPSPMVRIMWERWGCCNDVNSLVWELGCC